MLKESNKETWPILGVSLRICYNMLNFAKVKLGIMDVSKYIDEATAYDKKLMLERKEPHERSWDSLPSGHNRVNFAFETLRAEYFVRAKVGFVESDFDSLGLVAGISPCLSGIPDKSVYQEIRIIRKSSSGRVAPFAAVCDGKPCFIG